MQSFISVGIILGSLFLKVCSIVVFVCSFESLLFLDFAVLPGGAFLESSVVSSLVPWTENWELMERSVCSHGLVHCGPLLMGTGSSLQMLSSGFTPPCSNSSIEEVRACGGWMCVCVRVHSCFPFNPLFSNDSSLLPAPPDGNPLDFWRTGWGLGRGGSEDS